MQTLVVVTMALEIDRHLCNLKPSPPACRTKGFAEVYKDVGGPLAFLHCLRTTRLEERKPRLVCPSKHSVVV